MFGNGFSSSPSNTPEPFHGPRFPVMTIRDNVEAVRRLLADDLGITHVRAIIGFSMGAEQAFQWAVSHPAFADRIVATWPRIVLSFLGGLAWSLATFFVASWAAWARPSTSIPTNIARIIST